MSYTKLNRGPEEPIHPDVILALDLLKVGDSGDFNKASLKKDMEDIIFKLNEYIERDIDLLINIFMPSVCKQPIKAPIYATFVSLLKDRYPHFAKLVVQKTANLFQSSLENFDCFSSRVFLRFIGELMIVQVIEIQSYFTTFQQFANECFECFEIYRNFDPSSATDEEIENLYNSKARSDFFLAIILDILPFVGKELLYQVKDPFIDILNQIDVLLSMRSNLTLHNHLLDIFPNSDNQYLDPLMEIWERIVQSFTASRGANVNIGAKDWLEYEEKWDSVDHLFLRPPIDQFPNYYAPTPPVLFPPILITPHGEMITYDRRVRSVFRIFDKSKVEENLTPVSRVIIEQYILDLITTFNNSHRECIQNLCNLPFDENLDYLFLETVFGQLFKLPTPKFNNIYYGVLIVDFCKENAKCVPILIEAVNLLYSRLGDLNGDCFDRFTEWFAFHLSNINWKWDWKYWIEVAETNSSSHPLQRQFIIETIENAIRLSYYERIIRTLPVEFHSFLPPKLAVNYSYEDNQYAKNFVSMLVQKVEIAQITDYIDSLDFLNTDEDRLQFVFESFFYSGSKTTLHLINYRTELYKPFLLSLTFKREQKMKLLKIISKFWQFSQHRIIILLANFLTLQILDNISIILWIFSPEMRPHLKQSYVWKILRNTINKTVDRLRSSQQRRTKLLREKRDQSFNYNNNNDDENNNNNNNNNDYSIDNELLSLNQSIDEYSNDLKLLFTSIFQEYSYTMDDIQNFDTLTVFRLHGHLEEIARRYAPEIRLLIENDFHKNYEFNAKISELLMKIKSFK